MPFGTGDGDPARRRPGSLSQPALCQSVTEFPGNLCMTVKNGLLAEGSHIVGAPCTGHGGFRDPFQLWDIDGSTLLLLPARDPTSPRPLSSKSPPILI